MRFGNRVALRVERPREDNEVRAAGNPVRAEPGLLRRYRHAEGASDEIKVKVSRRSIGPEKAMNGLIFYIYL